MGVITSIKYREGEIIGVYIINIRHYQAVQIQDKITLFRYGHSCLACDHWWIIYIGYRYNQVECIAVILSIIDIDRYCQSSIIIIIRGNGIPWMGVIASIKDREGEISRVYIINIRHCQAVEIQYKIALFSYDYRNLPYDHWWIIYRENINIPIKTI